MLTAKSIKGRSIVDADQAKCNVLNITFSLGLNRL